MWRMKQDVESDVGGRVDDDVDNDVENDRIDRMSSSEAKAPRLKRVFIVAGEESGDMHASNLIRQVTAIRPEVQFEGFGGERMERAGCRLHANILHLAGMGLSFLQNIFKFIELLRRFYKLTRDHRPDALVLVDFPGFNFLLARLARLRGVPVVYYICPQIWAWAPWRRSKILSLTDLLMVIFPFEVDFYGGRMPAAEDNGGGGLDLSVGGDGEQVVYVGHPLADALADMPPREEISREFRRAHDIPDDAFVIGVFPGSRDHEIESLLPFYRKTLDSVELDPDRVVLMVSCCRERYRPLIEDHFSSLSVVRTTIVDGDARPLMASCDLALVASGTATLEVAFFERPMLVFYRVSRRDHAIYRFVCTSPFVSLVNILAQEEAVPEEVTHADCASPEGREALRRFLRDAEARRDCEERLRQLNQEVFRPGGSRLAAETLVGFLERH